MNRAKAASTSASFLPEISATISSARGRRSTREAMSARTAPSAPSTSSLMRRRRAHSELGEDVEQRTRRNLAGQFEAARLHHRRHAGIAPGPAKKRDGPGARRDRDVHRAHVLRAVESEIFQERVIDPGRRLDCHHRARRADGARSEQAVIADMRADIAEHVARLQARLHEGRDMRLPDAEMIDVLADHVVEVAAHRAAEERPRQLLARAQRRRQPVIDLELVAGRSRQPAQGAERQTAMERDGGRRHGHGHDLRPPDRENSCSSVCSISSMLAKMSLP